MSKCRTVMIVLGAIAFTAVAAAPAGACGGLVGENGSIQLVKTTTLAAYHDGVERYVTSFEFTGEGEEVGSIVPLPGVPTEVVRGGDWTLQRLVREVAPPLRRSSREEAATAADESAQVLLETTIDALDITVLQGGGDQVGEWAVDNGFFLSPDAPEVLDFYAERSQIFMAAKFDASRAAELGQTSGDGTPIILTIPTDRPWVPLRILALGLDESQVVEADVFLLTDDEPQLLVGGPGLSIGRSEPAAPALLADLRSDVGMEWVPDSMWLTYLQLEGRAGDLDYDLAVSTDASVFPSTVDAGVEPAGEAVPVTVERSRPLWPAAAGAAAAFRAADGLPPPAAATGSAGAGMRRRYLLAVATVAALGTAAAGYALDSSSAGASHALGPGRVTVELGIEHSRFSFERLEVRPGTVVRFVVRNHDPIAHELIVGDAEVHRVHASGTEAVHPPVPGEVSVGPGQSASTVYAFDEPGTVVFACHLPGHLAYGMEGEVVVTPR